MGEMNATNSLSDEQVWRQISHFDNVKAMEFLFKSHYSGLCGYVLRIVNSKSGAEDIIQNLMMQLWDKRKQIYIQTSVKAYLYRAAHNAALNVVKREQKIERPDFQASDFQENSGLCVMPQNESMSSLQKKIAEAINALPDKCRLVFLLSREKNLKYQEIAEALEISVKTVENHMSKALKIMHAHLGDLLFLYLCFKIGGEIYA